MDVTDNGIHHKGIIAGSNFFDGLVSILGLNHIIAGSSQSPTN
jgi:hypothetical protein